MDNDKENQSYVTYTQRICVLHITDQVLIAYSDADWTGDKCDRKSVSGSVIYIYIYHGENPILWSSQKQQSVALSTAEAEYVACAMTLTNLIYLQSVLIDLYNSCEVPCMYVDNQRAINMAERYENSKRSRHIDIKMHFIKDVSKGSVLLKYVSSTENIADIFTKSLSSMKHCAVRYKLKIVDHI